MKKITVAIDSFKGCLTSMAVEQAVMDSIHSLLPSCQVEVVPIADGGEGMLDVMVQLTHGRYVETEAHDPLMRPVVGRYGVTGDETTAIIEMAQVSGLPLLAENERNPMKTTSYGTGELIAHALSSGFRRFLIGIGGSATNDAGMGMMQALGARFYDGRGNELSTGCGKLLASVASVDMTAFEERVADAFFATACDVSNPFCGKEGAAFVFARQKGASDEEVVLLDSGMQHFATVVQQVTGVSLTALPGAGAAGGIGGALAAFFHSTLQPGIELILEKIDFENKIKGADLIITGEGKADCQTLMGKVPAGVLKYGQRLGIPVVLLAGAVENPEFLLESGFAGVYAVTPVEMALDEAMQPEVARRNIKKKMIEVMHDLSGN